MKNGIISLLVALTSLAAMAQPKYPVQMASLGGYICAQTCDEQTKICKFHIARPGAENDFYERTNIDAATATELYNQCRAVVQKTKNVQGIIYLDPQSGMLLTNKSAEQ